MKSRTAAVVSVRELETMFARMWPDDSATTLVDGLALMQPSEDTYREAAEEVCAMSAMLPAPAKVISVVKNRHRNAIRCDEPAALPEPDTEPNFIERQWGEPVSGGEHIRRRTSRIRMAADQPAATSVALSSTIRPRRLAPHPRVSVPRCGSEAPMATIAEMVGLDWIPKPRGGGRSATRQKPRGTGWHHIAAGDLRNGDQVRVPGLSRRRTVSLRVLKGTAAGSRSAVHGSSRIGPLSTPGSYDCRCGAPSPTDGRQPRLKVRHHRPYTFTVGHQPYTGSMPPICRSISGSESGSD